MIENREKTIIRGRKVKLGRSSSGLWKPRPIASARPLWMSLLGSFETKMSRAPRPGQAHRTRRGRGSIDVEDRCSRRQRVVRDHATAPYTHAGRVLGAGCRCVGRSERAPRSPHCLDLRQRVRRYGLVPSGHDRRRSGRRLALALGPPQGDRRSICTTSAAACSARPGATTTVLLPHAENLVGRVGSPHHLEGNRTAIVGERADGAPCFGRSTPAHCPRLL